MLKYYTTCKLTDFWSSVEPSHQIRCHLVFCHFRGGTKITEFQYEFLFINEYVVRFDISVYNVALSKQLQSAEQLVRVGPNGLDVQSNVFAVFL